MSTSKKMFINCKFCGKRLIQRKQNGIFKFVFGARKTKDGESLESPPVDIEIHGSIKMKCPRKTCGQYNILNYFPNTITFQSANPESEESDNQKTNLTKED